MAALTITAANVVESAITGIPVQKKTATAGATITAGQPIYLDSTAANVAKVCDSNASQAAAQCVGIALHGALTGQPVTYIWSGPLAFGAILTKGKIYVVGAVAAGDINPADDLASGWYSTMLGYAFSTSVLVVHLVVSDVPLT